MAVKQNNTDSGAAPAAGGGGAAANASPGSKANVTGGVGGAVGGVGTKAKSGTEVAGNSGVIDQPEAGCSGASVGTALSVKPKVGLSGVSNGGVSDAAAAAGNIGAASKSTDIAQILQLIELVELREQHITFGQDIVMIYRTLIVELSRVQIPRHSPDELKRFKEDIVKVGAFFRKANEKRFYLFYLRVVCQLITQSDGGEGPSCALAIIFQLFSNEMVLEAVQSMLDHKISDQNIRKTVRLLCEWLRMCNFCQNLNLWIIAILSGLQEQQKHALFDEIATENIEHLFTSLILPVLRPKVAPIVYHMLSAVDQTPAVFHKILPKFPRVMSCLKQQANSQDEEYAEDTKKFLQDLVDLTKTLMVRFYGYDELYEPVELAIKDIPPSYGYLSYANNLKNAEDSGMGADAMLHDNNAKVGLVNLGNTCYMNSVLQALAMTKEFSREILLSCSESPLLIKMQQQIALMLYSVRYELTPSRVLNATRPPGFSPGLQQDSSEYLGYLLETLHEQEIAYRKKSAAAAAAAPNTPALPAPPVESESESDAAEPIAKTAKQTDSNSLHEANSTEGAAAAAAFFKTSPAEQKQSTNNPIASDNDDKTSQKSLAVGGGGSGATTIEKTFTGKLATTYKCLTCGWKSRIVDSFRDLQLSFPEVKNDCASNYSVQDLIDYYCSPEKLDGENQYFCERCKKLCDAERYINVISAPKNLILTLKHFKYDQKYHTRAKLMHKVFHDEKVSLKVCSAETLDEIASVHYDLYAGVVHSGFSMDSGHYYTYAADINNKWYKFNDNIVTPSKSEELHNLTPPNTPYILFYQMGARSNDAVSEASSKVVKVDVPSPLALEELPTELRSYVDRDNCIFAEELKERIFKNGAAAALRNARAAKSRNNGRGGGGGARSDYDDDNDQDQPPPSSGCGGNALDINVNRFVY